MKVGLVYLLTINMLLRAFRPRWMLRHSQIHVLQSKISFEPEESRILQLLRDFARHQNNVTVRIAGGWVRDKLLGVATKPDIDIAVDTLSGVEFARLLSLWTLKSSGQKIELGVIQSNPDRSKHLETAAFRIGKYSIDVVNLRTENYTESIHYPYFGIFRLKSLILDSRIPIIAIGTPEEDAFRRDLTINSLFYNVNEEKIEDFTGKGIAGIYFVTNLFYIHQITSPCRS